MDRHISIADLKRACSNFIDYALNGLGNWRDARDASEQARPVLSISKDVRLGAPEAMGPAGAVVPTTYLVKRAAEIKSAVGYLRALSEKAEIRKFHLRPMIASLMNR